jgi:hypothetical protein
MALIFMLSDDRIENTATIQTTPLIEMCQTVGDAFCNHQPLAFTTFHLIVLPFAMEGRYQIQRPTTIDKNTTISLKMSSLALS